MLTIIGQQRVIPYFSANDRYHKIAEASLKTNEESVMQRLAPLRDSLPLRHQARVSELVLGPATGIAYLEEPSTSLVVEDDIAVVFLGTLDSYFETEEEDSFQTCLSGMLENLDSNSQAKVLHCRNPAERVLHLYKLCQWPQVDLDAAEKQATIATLQSNSSHIPGFESKADSSKNVGHPEDAMAGIQMTTHDSMMSKDTQQSHVAEMAVQNAADVLGQLKGSFAFILYDGTSQRVVAARDNGALEPLFWGAPTFGDGLLFSTNRLLVEDEAADADQFPPGTLFSLAPEDGTCGTGCLISFDAGSKSGLKNLSSGGDIADEAYGSEECNSEGINVSYSPCSMQAAPIVYDVTGRLGTWGSFLKDAKFDSSSEDEETEANNSEINATASEMLEGPSTGPSKMYNPATEATRSILHGATDLQQCQAFSSPSQYHQISASNAIPADTLTEPPAVLSKKRNQEEADAGFPLSSKTGFKVAAVSAAAATAVTAVTMAAAVQRRVVMRRVGSREGLCRPSSRENLSAMGEFPPQISSK